MVVGETRKSDVCLSGEFGMSFEPACFKSVFFPLVSYPRPTGADGISCAIKIASLFNAHLTAVAFGLDVRLPVGAFADVFAFGEYIVEEYRRCTTNAKAAIEDFETQARRQSLSHASRLEQCAPPEIASRVVELSHVHDLSVVAVKKGDGGQRDVVEAMLFGSGRPLLLFPEAVAKDLSSTFERITIAWNNTGSAARSVASALPLLRAAKTVRIVSIAEEAAKQGSGGYERSSLELAQTLSRHDIQASFAALDKKGDSTGQVLVDDMLVSKSDLLVMGGYGHARLKELILGGVTDTMLNDPPGFVLISH